MSKKSKTKINTRKRNFKQSSVALTELKTNPDFELDKDVANSTVAICDTLTLQNTLGFADSAVNSIKIGNVFNSISAPDNFDSTLVHEFFASESYASESTSKGRGKKHRNKLGFVDPTVSGIDIGDKEIYVAIPDGRGDTYVKDYGTTTPELNEIGQDLKNAGVTTAVMEATGVYWIPLYEILEDIGLTPVLADAKSVKNVPGRKTDAVDCQWIQTLYSSGLITPAFRPPRDRIPLRQFVRQRLIEMKSRQYGLNRMEKSLQLMNIKLSSALSDIGGISGMAIIRAIVKGERDPVRLASFRNTRCRQPVEKFIAALTGNFQKHHIYSLKKALELYDFANEQVEDCDKQILAELELLPDVVKTPPPENSRDKKNSLKYNRHKKPSKNNLHFNGREVLWRKSGVDITALCGIRDWSALIIFSELGGTELNEFDTKKHFCSWLKICSGNNISGGKRRKSKKQPSANLVTQTLRMAAMSAKKTDTAVGAHIRRICGRSEKPKGIKAGAHKLAQQLFYMCKYGWIYYEEGADEYEKRHEDRAMKSMQKKAKKMGYKLVLIEE